MDTQKDTINYGQKDKFMDQKGHNFIVSGVLISKSEKIVTALFMVTDFMDKDEPLRTKIRTLSLGLLSDIKNLSEIISLINVAVALRLVSEMNASILIKELNFIKKEIEEKYNIKNLIDAERSASDTSSLDASVNFFKSPDTNSTRSSFVHKIGLETRRPINFKPVVSESKNTRRNSILSFIKDKKEVMIKDIVTHLQGLGEDRGEKTIQRELLSLLREGLIKKTGEKRWSRYSIA